MSLQTKFPKEEILGLEVDNLGMSQASSEIFRILKQKRAHYIVKPYVEFFSHTTEKSRSLLSNAYLALPDGVSLNWAVYFNKHTARHWWDAISSAAKIVLQPNELHLALPNHSWGTNFTLTLLKDCAERGKTVYLVGSPKKSTIANTKKFLERKVPGLKIAGTFSGRDGRVGYFTNAMEAKLRQELKRLKPDIVLIGLGFPLQEAVCARLAAQLNHGVLIGEGGTFDFTNFGGYLRKAPLWMQRVGLEWLWRLMLEPSRIRRQLAIPRFMWQVYRANRRKPIAKVRA